MKIKTMLAALALAAASGCATVHISSPGTLAGVDVKGAGGRADRAIMVSNGGIYLFHCIPMVSGCMEWVPGANGVDGGAELFTDNLAGKKMMAALCRYADSRGCDLVDIVINDKNECKVGFFDLTDWASTLLAYRSITYSGVLCPRAERNAKGKVEK
ncbi:MAG: hypothetical protein IKF72_11365 [Kiritimatiellae bacterium]|nr:hypothetical protein [Kiritimatiellia bacterium]